MKFWPLADKYDPDTSIVSGYRINRPSSRESNPSDFKSAIDNAGRIGFVLGGGDGLGHGVFATGPARIVVTGFTVE